MNPGEIIKPPLEKDLAVKLIRELYGFRAKDVKEFNSYDDRNYFFKTEDNGNPHVTGTNIKKRCYNSPNLAWQNFVVLPRSSWRGRVRFEGDELEGLRAGRILRRTERDDLGSCQGRAGDAGMLFYAFFYMSSDGFSYFMLTEGNESICKITAQKISSENSIEPHQ